MNSEISDKDISIVCNSSTRVKEDEYQDDQMLRSSLKRNLPVGSPTRSVYADNVLKKSDNFDKTYSASMDSSLKSNESNIVGETENAHVLPIQKYYHKHFVFAIETVFKDAMNIMLFNDSDLKVITIFKNLSDQEQSLYIRLFGRKHQWIRGNNIKYPEIANDLSTSLNMIVDVGLLEDVKCLSNLESALNLLLLPELKTISKHFNIGSDLKGKQLIIESILQHCKKQQHASSFFNAASIEKKVLFKVKEVIGSCFMLQPEYRKVFVRVLLLFSLTGLIDEEDSANGGQQKTLLNLLMVDRGDLKFPKYTMLKENPVFLDRDSLIRYEHSKQLEFNILNACNEKSYQLAYDLYLTAKQHYESNCTSEHSWRDSSHPTFLRQFTASHVYVRCLNLGVDILQKLKQYQDAVDLIWLLLKQQHYCQSYRGHWWDRLTLLLDYHHKSSQLAIDALRQALRDQKLLPAHKFVLSKRAKKIVDGMKKKEVEKAKAKRKKHDTENEVVFSDFQDAIESNLCVEEAPKVTIAGQLFPGHQTGYKSVYILPSATNSEEDADINLLSVEELALDHYRQEGYSKGIHGEGSSIVSLFCLLFWDVLYESEIPDVYQSSYQAWPLDLNTDDFYVNRKSSIDQLLLYIRESSKEELENRVGSCWGKQAGVTSLVNWDLLGSPNTVKELVRLLPNHALAGICERLAKNFYHFRSGFPDLIVWNPVTDKIKVVEVKSPQDRLSPKQIIWLHILLQLNVPSEVCHIKAVGAKKLA